eukprot:GHVR01092513.1.p1 GENE.GHVR01092513.1~~GHVR01092513.1.p1  ORF type:complete len:112 (+),score=17.59 GHVR01092513.1:838-1173(+)
MATVVLVFGLGAFALTTKMDFTGCGIYLLAAALAVFSISIVIIIWCVCAFVCVFYSMNISNCVFLCVCFVFIVCVFVCVFCSEMYFNIRLTLAHKIMSMVFLVLLWVHVCV